MKMKLILSLSIILLTASSCKKTNTKPPDIQHGIDITKAVNSGALFIKWIINDDDGNKATGMQNSTVFLSKLKPELTFDKQGTFVLNYTDSLTHKPVTESGTWRTDVNSNCLIIKGPSYEYSFTVNTLDEEDLILAHVIQTSQQIKTSEGVVSTQQVSIVETLYMEDDD